MRQQASIASFAVVAGVASGGVANLPTVTGPSQTYATCTAVSASAAPQCRANDGVPEWMSDPPPLFMLSAISAFFIALFALVLL